MGFSTCDNQPGSSQSSSSRLSRTPTLEEQVVELVEKYRGVKSLSPILPREQIPQFLEVLERHMRLIKSRSQAFEDGHITIYDKALLSLTRNGSDLHNVGAFELYLDEVVGIGRGDSPAQMGKVLDKHIEVHSLLCQVSGSESMKSERKRDVGVSILTNGESKANIQRLGQPNGLTVIEDKLSHILAVYAKAKADYFVIDESDVEKKSRAAKFLRDTAENTLLYIKAQKSDHRLIPELESTHEMAKDKAITLSGGRKRRFEVCDMDNVQGVPKKPKRAITKRHYQAGNEYYERRSRDFHRGSSYTGGGRRRADCYRPY